MAVEEEVEGHARVWRGRRTRAAPLASTLPRSRRTSSLVAATCLLLFVGAVAGFLGHRTTARPPAAVLRTASPVSSSPPQPARTAQPGIPRSWASISSPGQIFCDPTYYSLAPGYVGLALAEVRRLALSRGETVVVVERDGVGEIITTEGDKSYIYVVLASDRATQACRLS